MKKIIFIHHCAIKGGSSMSLCNNVEGLKKDYDITIYSPKGSVFDILNKLNVKIVEIPLFTYFAVTNGVRYSLLKLTYRFKYFLNLFKISRSIHNTEADIIHFNEIGTVLLLYLLRNHNSKKVIHARAVASKKHRIINKIVSNFVNKYAHSVIFIDESVQKSYYQIKNYNIIYNSFSKKVSSIEDKMDSPFFNVLFLGLLNESNGIFDLISSAEILKNNKNIKFHVAGGFSRSTNTYNKWWMKVLDRFNILPDIEKKVMNRINNLDNFVYLGFVDNIEKLFSEIDILIFPSYYNGTGRSVFELGMYGIPSIVTLEDKIEDIVEDGINGVILPPKQPKIIAKKLIHLSNNKKIIDEMGMKAKVKYSIQHNEENNQNLIKILYNRLLDV